MLDYLTHFLCALLYKLPPELAHDVAITFLRWTPNLFIPRLDPKLIQNMGRTVAGIRFAHPVGLAAGFDKDACVFHKLGSMGFSFVEVGSITPKPQPGNPSPRLFSAPDIGAIVNRYGFNSRGIDHAISCLRRYVPTSILGINLGKNKDQKDSATDFAEGARRLSKFGHYITINVSSPNTPGLRNEQNVENLESILTATRRALEKEKCGQKPIFIKLSPDMPLKKEEAVIDYLASSRSGVAGVIVCNTTMQRPRAYHSHPVLQQEGGLSGRPLRAIALSMLQRVVKQSRGRLAIISCGGIETARDVYERLSMGADLVQLYTSFIFQGPRIIRRILLHLQTIEEKCKEE